MVWSASVNLNLFQISIEWFRTLKPISGWVGWVGWLSLYDGLLRAPTVLIMIIIIVRRFKIQTNAFLFKLIFKLLRAQQQNNGGNANNNDGFGNNGNGGFGASSSGSLGPRA